MNKAIKPTVDWLSIQLVIFDCDGVLSDGKIIYGSNSNLETMELKNFNAHDGMGFMLLHTAGLLSAVITGRTSSALSKRCKDLRIKHVFQKVQNKLEKADKLLTKLNLSWSRVVYMGDDWNDIPCMQQAAFSACPSDAMPEIQKLADLVTERKAGEGAVRELIDFILRKKGVYEQVVDSYLREISL
ncbi:MAG: HAD-IIIA family hydrolase [Candidatus Cloacimonadaceae bacterium]